MDKSDVDTAERASDTSPNDGVEDEAIGNEPTEVHAAVTLEQRAATPSTADVRVKRRRRPTDGPTTEQMIGALLVDRYRIMRRIGTGGFGAVFEAEDTKIHKRVAVKVLTRDLLCDAAVLARFRQEAEAASQVGHENIIDITDYDHSDDGHYFMVMEYLEGTDLGTLIRSGAEITMARILGVMIQVCRALHAAHGKGVLHRDLKPANIFLTTRGSRADFVKVLDFGISKFLELDETSSRLTKTGQIVGTPLYMSPEQAAGEDGLDARADIYSLGVIMYELLTGRPPFRAANYLGIIAQHAAEPPVPPSRARPELGIPPEVEHIVLRCLAKRPADRFSDMAQLEVPLVAALATIDPSLAIRYAVDESAASLLASRTGRGQSGLGRGRRAPLLTVVALAVAAGGGLAVFAVIKHRTVVAPSDVARDSGSAAARPDAGGVVVAPPATQPAAAQVTLQISSTPSAATVHDGDGRVLGATPLVLHLRRSNAPLKLVLKHTGHGAATLNVVPSRDQTLDVPLKKRPRGGALPDDPKGWGGR